MSLGAILVSAQVAASGTQVRRHGTEEIRGNCAVGTNGIMKCHC